MDTSGDNLDFLRKMVGIMGILAGLLLMFLFLIMQGAPLFVLGIPFVLFGILVLYNKIYMPLILLITPVVILFSLFIVMSMIDKSGPKYTQIPIEIGVSIISPFWIVLVGGIYLWKKNRGKKISKN